MQSARALSTLALALACAGAIPAFGQAAQAGHAAPVLAQELTNVRASGKVMAALWTARKDTYTLQLVFPITATTLTTVQPTRTDSMEEVRIGTRIRAAGVTLQPTQQQQPASVQVWLLKADGTQVFPVHGFSSPKAEGLPAGGRTISYSYTYPFPLAESGEAVAIAVRINGDFYIDQLKPLR